MTQMKNIYYSQTDFTFELYNAPRFSFFLSNFPPFKNEKKKKVIENTCAFKICCFMLKVEKINVIKK